MTTEIKAIYVVKTTLDDAKAKYDESFRGGYRIVSKPMVGDAILDVLTVTKHGDRLQVSSEAAWAEGSLKLASTWSWGDQYEEGAELELRDACLSALFYGPGEESTVNFGENNDPLFPLTWAIAEGDDYQIHGKFWQPAKIEA